MPLTKSVHYDENVIIVVAISTGFIEVYRQVVPSAKGDWQRI